MHDRTVDFVNKFKLHYNQLEYFTTIPHANAFCVLHKKENKLFTSKHMQDTVSNGTDFVYFNINTHINPET